MILSTSLTKMGLRTLGLEARTTYHRGCVQGRPTLSVLGQL